MKIPPRRAQALVDYALILALVALIILAVLTLLGSQVANSFRRVLAGLNGQQPANIQTIATDFMQRTASYYQAHGYYPPTWGDGRYTALGLNPADWQTPVAGIQWNPNGDYIGLANVSGDNIQVYARDTQGNLLHLYDGWDIWCQSSTGRCFYHSATSGIEINLSTIYTTTN